MGLPGAADLLGVLGCNTRLTTHACGRSTSAGFASLSALRRREAARERRREVPPTCSCSSTALGLHCSRPPSFSTAASYASSILRIRHVRVCGRWESAVGSVAPAAEAASTKPAAPASPASCCSGGAELSIQRTCASISGPRAAEKAPASRCAGPAALLSPSRASCDLAAMALPSHRSPQAVRRVGPLLTNAFAPFTRFGGLCNRQPVLAPSEQKMGRAAGAAVTNLGCRRQPSRAWLAATPAACSLLMD